MFSSAGPSDYITTMVEWVLEPTQRFCTSIPIVDDTVPEIPANFTVTLSTEANPLIQLNSESATVTINDDDGKYMDCISATE